jgi:hypothetical protein
MILQQIYFEVVFCILAGINKPDGTQNNDFG